MNTKRTQTKRSAAARFGSEQPLEMRDGTTLDIGSLVMSGGPGEGVVILPWALFHYAKVLRLRPGEAWLLSCLLSHAWEHGKLVFPSMSKIELEADVTRQTLGKYARRLEELNLVRCLGPKGGADWRNRYDVSPTYVALALCIVLDPCSNWNKERGGITAQPHPGLLDLYDLDLDALARLNRGIPPEASEVLPPRASTAV